ncbi:MAG: DUF4331 family protein [Labilithrix sp.]
MKRITKGAALVAGTCLALALLPRLAKSADHLDAPATKADHTADINDLYSWMDGTNAVFAITVFPAAPAGTLFSDKVQYVIHTTSSATFGGAETNKDIICTFSGTAAPQKTSCWLGATDAFVEGNADSATGITSTDGKMKVFAGLRKDPFFFNLDGFNATVATVKGAAPSLNFDAGCPLLDDATGKLLRDTLQQDGGGGTGTDFFKDLNTLAIVVSVDKTLVTGGGPIVSAWASTHKAP